jgi:hypothetical protein
MKLKDTNLVPMGQKTEEHMGKLRYPARFRSERRAS